MRNAPRGGNLPPAPICFLSRTSYTENPILPHQKPPISQSRKPKRKCKKTCHCEPEGRGTGGNTFRYNPFPLPMRIIPGVRILRRFAPLNDTVLLAGFLLFERFIPSPPGVPTGHLPHWGRVHTLPQWGSCQPNNVTEG